ncbi:MAG: hypothetical protein ACK44W_16535, partial [Planctomycetota bacterium]
MPPKTAACSAGERCATRARARRAGAPPLGPRNPPARDGHFPSTRASASTCSGEHSTEIVTAGL